jgi:hypothetical protein
MASRVPLDLFEVPETTAPALTASLDSPRRKSRYSAPPRLSELPGESTISSPPLLGILCNFLEPHHLISASHSVQGMHRRQPFEQGLRYQGGTRPADVMISPHNVRGVIKN